ncbi:PREDICTED: sphingosine 1-phosphate receptor 1-like [Branchiostoma belcheri]|uniref:Sphingosine 1-phosphate receptor 1-like n=1 Tax=Branchiostoma belcheri TaxID=7741 RepID=A0A6P4YSR4_BRABE|nr:PREDICTED: sphingosine 1-phosphate receptor 1-like [Branchiostoma belcheri]
MFNNSSNPGLPTEETFAAEFHSILSCYKWHLTNNFSVLQANEACSAYEDLVRLRTETEVIFLLMGLLIIVTNPVLLLGIIGARELHKPVYFFLANLAVSDFCAGAGLLYRAVGYVGYSAMYKTYGFLLGYVPLLIFTQMMSSSALTFLSVNNYVAIRYPVYFHNNADELSTKLCVGVALIVSWISIALVSFSPIMGWNCLDMGTLTTRTCIKYYPLAFVVVCAAIGLLLCSIILFTNVSVYVRIREREKKRLEQAGSTNAAQQEALRRYEERVYKARTVMIHVILAFTFWLLPLLIYVYYAVCRSAPGRCPTRTGIFAGICLNSLINPIATLLRTSDLRKAIWDKVTGVHQTIVRVIRGNRAHPQDDQAGIGDAPNFQLERQNTQSQPAPKELPLVENYDIHNAHRMAEPERWPRGRQAETLAMVQVD